MRKFLRWFVEFLDRKFPEKVVVTAELYKSQVIELAVLKATLGVHAERIAKLEGQLANINIAVGFTMPKAGVLER